MREEPCLFHRLLQCLETIWWSTLILYIDGEIQFSHLAFFTQIFLSSQHKGKVQFYFFIQTKLLKGRECEK